MSAATLVAALMTDDVDWHSLGTCAGAGADLFFDPTHEASPSAREAQAKAVCVSCPVFEQCLEWALAQGEPSGVWAGGTSTTERRTLHAQLR
jgi:WhiB family redox-sensing transcriptional regulator